MWLQTEELPAVFHEASGYNLKLPAPTQQTRHKNMTCSGLYNLTTTLKISVIDSNFSGETYNVLQFSQGLSKMNGVLEV